MSKTPRWIALLIALAGTGAASARAAATYDVVVNTGGLHYEDPLTAHFQFSDGGDGINNMAVVSLLDVGTGTPIGSLADFPLVDDVFSPSDVFFVSGDKFSFRLNLTTNATPGDTPDVFTFGLYSGLSGQDPVNPQSGGTLARFSLPTVNSGVLAETFPFGDLTVDVTAVANAAPVPEVSSWVLLGAMGCAAGVTAQLRRLRNVRPVPVRVA